MSILNAQIWFTPSPTSELWAPVPSTPSKIPADERNRLSFGGGRPLREEFHSKYRAPYPSVAEYLFEVEVEGIENDSVALQRAFIQLIQGALPKTLTESEIFGYGCVHGNCRREMMLHSFGGVAPWIDQLGEKFENIYPILVGPLRSCEGLAAIIGSSSSVVRLSDNSTSAILSIPPSEVDAVRRNPAVKQWIVIRDLNQLGTGRDVVEELYRKYSAVPAIAPFLKA